MPTDDTLDKPRLIRLALAVALALAFLTSVAFGEERFAQQVTCTHIRGTGLSAPLWEPHDDGYADQEAVTLTWWPKEARGTIAWLRGNTYTGLALAMDNGFAIINHTGAAINVYHVNIASMDMLMVTTRQANSLLPSGASSFHATCRPGKGATD
jgi:hypothetical protein